LNTQTCHQAKSKVVYKPKFMLYTSQLLCSLLATHSGDGGRHMTFLAS